MKFLIQTINNNITHDFSFALIEAIKYQNWYNECKKYYKPIVYVTTNDIMMENYIPIGTVEFVSNYIEKYYGTSSIPKPINIPKELLDRKFTKRNIINGTNKNIKPNTFVKSNDKIKHFTEIIDNNNINTIPEGNYMISDIIDIQSEYRCFIYKNKLVGLQNYSGDFTLFPNLITVDKMINAYSNNAPIAYTLDVGIRNWLGTFIIEAHDFFSCGTYGFNDSRILPQMFSDWWNEYIRKIIIN